MLRTSATLLLTTGIALGSGWIVGLLTKTHAVPILVPMAVGAAAGLSLGFLLHLFDLRSRVLALCIGLVAWSAGMLALQWVEYRHGFVGAVRFEYELEGDVAGDPGYTDEEARAMADRILTSEVGRGGLVGFLALRMKGGLRLRGAAAPRLGQVWAAALWVLEMLVALGVLLRIGLGVQQRARVLSRQRARGYNAAPDPEGGSEDRADARDGDTQQGSESSGDEAR